MGANRIVAAGVGESLSGAEGAGVVCGRDSRTGAAGWGWATTADIDILNLFWAMLCHFTYFRDIKKYSLEEIYLHKKDTLDWFCLLSNRPSTPLPVPDSDWPLGRSWSSLGPSAWSSCCLDSLGSSLPVSGDWSSPAGSWWPGPNS